MLFMRAAGNNFPWLRPAFVFEIASTVAASAWASIDFQESIMFGNAGSNYLCLNLLSSFETLDLNPIPDLNYIRHLKSIPGRAGVPRDQGAPDLYSIENLPLIRLTDLADV